MKGTFFSVAALVASAFAAPVESVTSGLTQGLPIGNLPAGDVPATGDVGNAVHTIDEILTGDLGLGQIADEISKTTPTKRALTDSGDLVGLLSGLVESITGQTDLLNGIGQKVQNGDITKEEGQKQAAEQLGQTQFSLTKVVTEITGTAGLNVAGADVDKVLTITVTLVTVVLKTVNTLVTVLGITPQLNSLLASVLTLLANVLTLVTGLVAGIVPGLLAALSPLLAGLGNGLLAPLLTPIVALVAGLVGSTVGSTVSSIL
jgi:hypothetical protein